MQYFIFEKSNFFYQGDGATTLLEHISIPPKISEFSILKVMNETTSNNCNTYT